MLSQPQRRIGAGARVLAQATDHLDRGRRLVLLRAALEQPARIHAGELDLGEGHPRFDLLVAGWLRALPHPRAASSSRLAPSARVAIATLLATPPPRLSLSEHGQRAREAEVGEPDSHYLLVAIQVTAAVEAGRQSVWVKVACFEFAAQWRS